jgi:hypothetical protein
VAEAERAEFAESLRQKEAAAAKLGDDELAMQRMINAEALERYDLDLVRKRYDYEQQRIREQTELQRANFEAADQIRQRREREGAEQAAFLEGTGVGIRVSRLRREGRGLEAGTVDVIARARAELNALGADSSLNNADREARRRAILERSREELLSVQQREAGGFADVVSARSALFSGLAGTQQPLDRLNKTAEMMLQRLIEIAGKPGVAVYG